MKIRVHAFEPASRANRPGLRAVVWFQGCTLNWRVDVLVAGRYVASQRTGCSLIGSANQQIHLLTDRYTRGDLAAVPPRELVLHCDGTVSVSGLSPWRPSGI